MIPIPTPSNVTSKVRRLACGSTTINTHHCGTLCAFSSLLHQFLEYLLLGTPALEHRMSGGD